MINLLPVNQAKALEFDCTGIKIGQKIYWEGVELKPGQIGKLMVLEDTPLYRFVDGKPEIERMLYKGSTYRIYNFRAEYLGVGAGFYVVRDERVEYKTPSKQKLNAVKCANPKLEIPPVTSPIDEGTPPIQEKPPEKPQWESMDLGPQVSNLSTLASRAGMDQNGNAYLYVILHGTPSSLAVVDLNTNETKRSFSLGNSTSAWAMDVDSSGTVWVGGTTNGNLYSYNPNIDEFKDHGDMLAGTAETTIQDLAVTDYFVYGSTAYGASAFTFNKITGERESIKSASFGKQFAKSIAVEPDDRYVYISTGPLVDIFKWDIISDLKIPILNGAHPAESYAEKMKKIDDLLVVKFYPSKKANIYSLSSGTFLKEFMADSRGFSPKEPEKNEFYYTYDGNFYAYNLGTGTIRNTNARLPRKRTALSLDFIQLKSNPSRNILTGLIDNEGNYFLYNPFSNVVTVKKAILPSNPVNLHTLFTDSEQRYIYVNGFMTGGLTKFDSIERKGVQLGGVNQLESAIVMNGKLYGGAYPKARLIEITPNEFWDQSSIKELISLDKYSQERITAMAGYNNTHLFAGTYAQDSIKGGLLLDYDVATGDYRVYEDFITNQSIISLLPDEGYIYAGTSIHSNYRRAEFSAKFFRFNPDNPNEKEFFFLPMRATMVMSLIKGPDGDIWGAADGTIFAYNPYLNKFRSVKVLNAISGRFSNAKLLVGKDGFVYGTMEGRLFRINPADMSFTFLLESGAYEIAQDEVGNLYYRYLSNLYMIPVENLNQ
ncbi:YncE family protein [Neobacillus piezotolerans]|nr:hypothetical protein [Neobacillus piezotolerans]